MAPSLMVIEFENLAFRDKAEQVCELQGIQTRRWYQPLIHQHPTASDAGVLAPFPLPHAKKLASGLLGVPFHLDLNLQDMERVASALKMTLEQPPQDLLTQADLEIS